MSYSLSTLASNLQELYAVARLDNPQKALVPMPGGLRFVSVTSWQGRLLLFFYNRFDRFDEEWRHRRFVKAMEHTHQLYAHFHLEAQQHHQCMRAYIQARIEKKDVHESALREAKKFLTCWHSATTPFLKVLDKADAVFKRFLHTGFSDTKKDPAAAPFGGGNHTSAALRHQRIIDFEGDIGSSLPLEVFYKASIGKSLSRRENLVLASFAKKINLHPDRLSIHDLDKYLRALIDSFKESHHDDDAIPNLIELCTALFKRQNGIFQQLDPHHFEWRKKKCVPGKKLNCNGIEIVLGKSLGDNQAQENNNLVFEVANAPNLVAAFGINRLIISLKAQLAEEMGFGISGAEYLQIEEKGKFALIEKLSPQLTDHQWQSQKLPIDDRDINLLVPIIYCIRWSIAQNRSIARFHPNYLMFDQQGELKHTKYTIRLPFSFVDAENCIRAIAGNNSYIFRYIMQNSNLLQHEHARYFQKIVHAVCQDEEPDVRILSQVMKIKDFHYVDQALQLVKDLTFIKDACLTIIRQKHGHQKNLSKHVLKALLEIYTESCSVGTLPPDLQEKALKKLEMHPGAPINLNLPLSD